MLPKKHRLFASGATFVARRGAQLDGTTLRIKWAPCRAAISRATVVAGLAVEKRATKRNLVKRRIREALRPLLPHLSPPVNLMVFAQKAALRQGMGQLRGELTILLKRARLLS